MLCVYIYSMLCVWLCISNTHACLRYERCYIHEILIEKNRPTKKEYLYLGKYHFTLTYVRLACCRLFSRHLRRSGCGLDRESHKFHHGNVPQSETKMPGLFRSFYRNLREVSMTPFENCINPSAPAFEVFSVNPHHPSSVLSLSSEVI